MTASQEGQVECVKMLLDRGAKVNMQKEVNIIHWVHVVYTESHKWMMTCARNLF